MTKMAEKTLSKKELKKKELEELDAVLAELGLTKPKAGDANDSQGNILLMLIVLNRERPEIYGKIKRKRMLLLRARVPKEEKEGKSLKEVKESLQDCLKALMTMKAVKPTAGTVISCGCEGEAEKSSSREEKNRVKRWMLLHVLLRMRLLQGVQACCCKEAREEPLQSAASAVK
ncbi:hypothetical protein F3Y22_tig00112058pilonHSYRG00001 [Hibiscus syriacus]|uniref:Uncharacterized protein n=1 Tax=Hibiscus syriacus TaxID=106335 RepID=A0A6A2YCM9_HIBSY|nr:hypothetical protein F3Y22_tig00112058pilonHSYRG00001 [Hibiscus syriacus]